VRAVLDTNVVASALLWGGTPERLIEAAGDGALELFTSEALLAELAGILDAAPLEEPALRDPDDAAVLACAVAARAYAIVSGDGDLLELRAYQEIPVLNPADALARVLAGR
jgi:uncharacterized protein